MAKETNTKVGNPSLSSFDSFLQPIISACSNFATEQRGWFVLIFVLPVSVLFDLYFWLRAWFIQRLYSAPKLHEQRVKDIQRQIREFRDEQEKLPKEKRKKLCTARGGWQSISPSLRPYKEKARGIEINLYDILHFDEKQMLIKVEPMVNMGMISHFLIPKGFTIPCLPEMDDLTVGGLLVGYGIETSSHKYGLFNDTVVEVELVLADGSLVTCNENSNRELFNAVPWSYGTLGFITSVTLKVAPCQQYVQMWYRPCHTQNEVVQEFQRCTLQKKQNVPMVPNTVADDYFNASADEFEYDFVEELIYGKEKAVVMPAKYISLEEIQNRGETSKINKFSLWYKPWFYKHVATYLNFPAGSEEYEYFPLRDYFHRHTRSIFWELEEIIPFGNHPIVRYLLGWALPPKVSFLKVTQTEKVREIYDKAHVIQDMLVPFSKMKEALNVAHDALEIYPIWVCPYRAYDYEALSKKTKKGETEHRYFMRKPKVLEKGEPYEMYVDMGIYGIPKAVKAKQDFDIEATSRRIESYLTSVNGFQALYAANYQTRDELRTMFDHRFYDQMKSKYDPDGYFPEVYEKVCKKALKVWEKR